MRARQASDESLLQRLNSHPLLRQRLESILEVVEGQQGGLKRADDVEERLVQELRRLGQESLQTWAQGQVEQTEQAMRCYGGVHREGKKNFIGTAPLATSALSSPNTAEAAKDSARLRKARG